MHNRVYKRNKCTETQTLQKIEIVQFIAIAHDIALDLTGIDPRHVILHIARHEIGRISNNLRTDTNMTLFDEGGSSLNSLHHPTSNQMHRKSPPTKRRHSHLPLDLTQSSPLLATLLEYPHAPQFIKYLGLDLLSHRISVRV